MWNYTLPILIVVLSNTIYHICAKSTPANIHPFISLTFTYVISAIASIALYFVFRGDSHIAFEIKKLNWASIVLGISVIGLELGYILVYRVGWNISIGSLVANIGLAVALVLVGILMFRESISINQYIGIALCVLGIIFINR